MASDDTLELQRRRILRDAAQHTEEAFAKLGLPIAYLNTSLSIGEAVRDYRGVREQYAAKHGNTDGLLANHKVAALYVWTLIDWPADRFFRFPDGTSSDVKRVAMVTFMYFVIYGVLSIQKGSVVPALQEDLEYCLLKEPPGSIEWLCLAMHALCRFRGTATNTTS